MAGEEIVKSRIAFPVFEERIPAYATNFVMQRFDKEFILNYYVVLPPAVLTSPDEDPDAVKARYREITEIPARCVARVVLTEQRCVDFVKLMVNNLREAGLLDVKDLGLKDGD
jgi:hypothetical protein